MKMPRSFKKLSLLLAFIILITCVVTFQQYQNYPSVGVKGWEIRNHNQRLGGINSHTTTPRHLQESKSVKLLHQSAPPSEVHKDDLQNLDSPIAQDLLSRIKLNCLDHICSEFVATADRPHFDYCIKKTWKRRSRYKEPSDSICRFINGTGRSPIALASFPGSGNTWVRGLMQAATGLCTGAIYCDRTLRKTGFPGESIRSGIVLAVKTHHDDPRWVGVHYDRSAPFSYFKKVEHIPLYSSGIFILRNPFESLVAEYSRQLREEDLDSHVNLPKRQYFGEWVTRLPYTIPECLIRSIREREWGEGKREGGREREEGREGERKRGREREREREREYYLM